MYKMLIVFLNGVLVFTLGLSAIKNGVGGLYTGSDRWVSGVGCLIAGILCIYYSGAFQFIYNSILLKRRLRNGR